MAREETKEYTVESVRRALQILKVFQGETEQESAAYTLMQICGKTKLAPSTATRLLSTLCREGFLDYDAQSRQYRLSILFFQLGMSMYASISLPKVARPILEELSAACGLAVYLALIENDEIVVVDNVFPQSVNTWPRMLARSGYVLPIHSSGIARLYLSQFEDDRIRDILSRRPLTKFTQNTVTDVEEILRIVKRCRLDGLAACDCENEEFIASLCAPIFDHQGFMVAGISLGGIRGVIYGERREYFQEKLLDAAREITRKIGGSHPRR